MNFKITNEYRDPPFPEEESTNIDLSLNHSESCEKLSFVQKADRMTSIDEGKYVPFSCTYSVGIYNYPN